jgi:hypothetical protein
MKTAILVIGSVIAVAGVALVLLLSGGSGPDATSKPGAGSVAHGAQVPTPTDRPTPVLPQGSDVAAAEGTDYPKEYMVGDVRVRDHRSGNNKPLDLPPNPHPANARELPSELTHDITQQVRKKLFDCAAAVPATAKGAKPKLEGQLTVAIKDHVLSVSNLALQVRDIDGASADALSKCVQDSSASLTAAARDQDDLGAYGIAVTFAIP